MSTPDNINKNPFNTGPGYFENFAQKILESVDAYEEIKNEAPLLSNIPKYNPFDVPAGYFDELPVLVQQRCADAGAGTSIMDWLKMVFRPRFAIPVLTTVLIAFGGIYYMNNNSVSNIANNPVAEELSIDDQLQEIDETIIVDALTAEANTESVSDNADADIVDYLMENDIDEISLSTEL